MAQKIKDGSKTIAENRKARHNFEIQEMFEAGIVLQGSEVKSLRAGKASIAESYASQEGGEIFLINATIPEYAKARRDNHEPRRMRKLLLHVREMGKLIGAIERDGMTLIPLRLYFNSRGLVKLQLALAKGKKLHDKRQTEKTRDWNRQKARLLREKG